MGNTLKKLKKSKETVSPPKTPPICSRCFLPNRKFFNDINGKFDGFEGTGVAIGYPKTGTFVRFDKLCPRCVDELIVKRHLEAKYI
jgi:hypothetical protein